MVDVEGVWVRMTFWDGHDHCQHCGQAPLLLERHHVVYQQHAKREGANPHDARNALTLCPGCHAGHHNRKNPINVSTLHDANFEYAAEVFGLGAYDYLRRYYTGEDERLYDLLQEEAA